MRAKEFIDSDIYEIAPALAAIGGALLRGAAAGGRSVATGAGKTLGQVTKSAGQALGSIAKQAVGTAATSAATSFGSTAGTNLANKLTGQKPQDTKPQPPVQFPPGTKIEPVVSKDPNKLAFKVGDAILNLDTKDPANQQALRQLGSMIPAQE